MYFGIQHCFIRRPSESSVSEDAGIPGQLRLRHWLSDALVTRLHLIQIRLHLIHTRPLLINTRLHLIHTRRHLIHTRLHLILTRLHLIHTRLHFVHILNKCKTQVDTHHTVQFAAVSDDYTVNGPQNRALNTYKGLAYLLVIRE
jgi:hypothetical protein